MKCIQTVLNVFGNNHGKGPQDGQIKQIYEDTQGHWFEPTAKKLK